MLNNMDKENIEKVILEWLNYQKEYVDIITDNLDMVCLDGYYDFEDLINKLTNAK